MLTDLADACRKSGLNVVELPGWRDRGRPGAFAPEGINVHHTGGDSDARSYVDWMALAGRPDLGPPLSQLALSRGCTVFVMAAGRANHAGRAKARGTLPAGDGNTLRVGVEAMNNGTEGWDAVGVTADGERVTQREAYHRLCAALNAHYGWDVANTNAHWETSETGKWDPGDPAGNAGPDGRSMDMSEFRAAVGRLMEDDMAQHSDQLDRIERDLKIIKAALGAQRPIRRKLVRLNQRLKAALAKKENAA